MTTSDNTSESPGSTLHTTPGFAGRESHRSGPIAQMATDAAGSTPLTDALRNKLLCRDSDLAADCADLELFARTLELRCRSLAMIFPKILEALGNGSACVGEGNSIEFLQDIPNEVRLVVQGYQRRCRSLEAALKEAGNWLTGIAEDLDESGCEIEAKQMKKGIEDLIMPLAQGSGGGGS